LALAAFAVGCGERGTEPPGRNGVVRVQVSPARASIVVGADVTLGATALDSAGDTLRGTGFAWTSSDSAVARVSGGRVTGVARGTARIVATTAGRTDTSAIQVAAPPAVLIAVGDIASCNSDGDEATAALVRGIPGTIAALGDLGYEDGKPEEFRKCYDPTWGAFKDRTRPTPGNHDYRTAGAAGYFGYFGAAADVPPFGYYSYDLGAWHIVALNSMISKAKGSPQERWLRADLSSHPAACTLAYLHHARFSSGAIHGSDVRVQPIWQALYEAGADVVLGAHDHHYERFAPQRPDGTADSARGLREFVVGTGGRSHYPEGPRQPNSEVYDNTTFGVLVLTLKDGGYTWEFVPVAGGTFHDSGSGTCH
jgi:hypothetical protein